MAWSTLALRAKILALLFHERVFLVIQTGILKFGRVQFKVLKPTSFIQLSYSQIKFAAERTQGAISQTN